MSLIELCERGLVPDPLTRFGIRRLCARRLDEEGGGQPERARRRFEELLQQLRHSPVAIETAAANAQHYELPPRFFELCLGARLKYSSCYYATGAESLDEAEDAMLELYGERAQLADGQRILELGCGWGSLTLWMAARFPKASITAVSNSASQREHIEAARAERFVVELTHLDRVDRRARFEIFEAVAGDDDRLARLIEAVIGAADSLE